MTKQDFKNGTDIDSEEFLYSKYGNDFELIREEESNVSKNIKKLVECDAKIKTGLPAKADLTGADLDGAYLSRNSSEDLFEEYKKSMGFISNIKEEETK